MKLHILALFLMLRLALPTWAQLPQPLRFVAPDHILLLNPTESNLLQQVLPIASQLTLKSCLLNPEEVETYRQLHLHPQPTQNLDTLARLLLVSGEARYAHCIDSLKSQLLDSLQRGATKVAVAEQLLATVGMIAATDAKGVYINLLEDCMIMAKTENFAVTIDQIKEIEGHKYRISGLSNQGNTPLTLRFRLPHPTRPTTFYMNGRRLLRPHYEKGYLVVNHAWRNGDELFYRIN